MLTIEANTDHGYHVRDTSNGVIVASARTWEGAQRKRKAILAKLAIELSPYRQDELEPLGK